MTYRLAPRGVTRLADNKHVTRDMLEWEDYRAWSHAGNVPEPMPAPPAPAPPAQPPIADKIEALWSAANKYVASYISGVAIGILTVGVVQQKPKAIAVAAWSSAVWAEYYARKALVTADSAVDVDYTGFGPIPHSVPELQAEVGL